MNGLQILEERGEKRGAFNKVVQLIDRMLRQGHSAEAIHSITGEKMRWIKSVQSGQELLWEKWVSDEPQP